MWLMGLMRFAQRRKPVHVAYYEDCGLPDELFHDREWRCASLTAAMSAP